MMTGPIHLIDAMGAKVASLDIHHRGDSFGGTITLEATPSGLRQLFEQFEEVVEGQMFGLLDGIEEKIQAVGLRAVFATGAVAEVEDFQVYPSRNAVSFKTR